MRDYAIVLFILANLPVGIFQAYYGMLVYTWVSYMYPQLFGWSFSQSFPAAKLTAISAIVGTIVTRAGDMAALRQKENIAMVFLWLTFTISTAFAQYPFEAWSKWQDVSKVIMMALLTSMLVRNRTQMRYFLLVIALSLGYYGVKGGVFSIILGGESRIWGPEGTILGSNNAIGLALNMCLPIFWYLAQEETGYRRLALYGMFFLSIPAIMFTYSRASAITLPLILLAIIWRSRNRALLLCSIAIAGILALPFIPEKFWVRQQSILTYQNDGSAMSRIETWKFCWRVALDRPLTGAGFEFGTEEMFAKYAPETLFQYGYFNSHNVFLSILSSHGFLSLVAFLLMIGWSMLSCGRVRRDVRGRSDLRWMASYSYAVEISFLAFIANGMFVNMEYFDFPYDLVALTASLKVIAERASAMSEQPVAFTDDFVPVPVT